MTEARYNHAPADPSTLTTQQILRETGILRELLETNVTGVSALAAEKFEAVNRQFDTIERARVEQKKDTKDAVDAALTATFSAGITALTNAHNDTKDRVSRIESAKAGGSSMVAGIIAGVSVLVSIAMAVYAMSRG